MTLRKITIDNSVKYVVRNDHSYVLNEKDMRKKNELSQKNKKRIKNKAGEGFRVI